MTQSSRPIVLIPCCIKTVTDSPFHAVGDKYVAAVADGARALPWLMPALGGAIEAEAIIAQIDGLFLTGGLSMVEPGYYDGPPLDAGTEVDPARDATTLPLVRAAVAARLPILAICRGIQELNVALGGTLYQKVHEEPGRIDHRAPPDQPRAVKFAPAHEVTTAADGRLRQITGAARYAVNSLHWQGIDRLAPGLAVEALAPDGQIEAVRVTAYDDAPVTRADGFALGIQWHPEWRYWEDAPSSALFEAFAAAVADRHAARVGADRVAPIEDGRLDGDRAA